MQHIGFGGGDNGALSITSSVADSVLDSTLSASSGGTTGTGETGLAFAQGDLVLLHYTQGTGHGNWEINEITSYTSGTGAIVFTFTTANAYSITGSNKSQILKIKEYTSMEVSAAGTLTGKAWDRATGKGGILCYVVQGDINIAGSVTTTGKGFYTQGVSGATPDGSPYFGIGYSGDSYNGVGSISNSPNGGGGGGGGAMSVNAGGGGAAYSTSGTTATGSGSGGTGSTTTYGTADLSTIELGSAGGDCHGDSAIGVGGPGGGICMLFFGGTLTVTGTLSSNGSPGEQRSSASAGSGTGGSIHLSGGAVVAGTGLITANGATSPSTTNTGGTGGEGRINISACSITGTTSPTANETEGGQDWCQSFIHIYGTN